MDNDYDVRKELLELFEEEKLVDEWLNNPKWFFDGLTPLEILLEPDGKEMILTILNKIRYGNLS